MKKENIRSRARELGFDDCRFASADSPATAGRLTEWLACGRHGTMEYLARNARKRGDPQAVLPGARSIVCVALNYGAATPPAPKSPGETRAAGTGTIARYARYEDYHEVMGERLTRLAGRLDELGGPGTRSLWYVDTGPVLEREFAQRAGIGFVGKHTNVISRRFGNWILLGEILTTLELEPDAAERNRCGNCARCLSACPTGAITAPFQLDARRCISYLTIELKGPIPEEFRPAVGSRIFGCDDCLEVCPWNRFAAEGALLRRFRRGDLEQPDLLSLLALDNAAFKQRFSGTPIERSKRRGFLRNVCVALGNVGDRNALPALSRAGKDPEPLIARHASWAVSQIEARL